MAAGCPDPRAGDMHQQDGVGSAAAQVATGGQLILLLRAEIGPTIGSDQQPVGS